MYHYVALIWEEGNTSAQCKAAQFGDGLRASNARLMRVFCSSTMCVYAESPPDKALRAYVLPNQEGVVLGALFPTGSDSRSSLLDIDREEAEKIAGGAGQRLFDQYWGSFIAFITHHGRNFALRDCSGWIPCYWMQDDGITLVFSDLNDVLPIRPNRVSLNYRYLATFIYDADTLTRETGIDGVFELFAGERLELASGKSATQLAWNPCEIARRRSIEEFSHAETELRGAVESCISSWASTYTNILLNLSGGLDSAIVLGCLTQAPQKPTVACLNQYSEGTADDERHYARIAASKAGVPLYEQPWSDPRYTDRVFSIAKAPKPYPGDVYLWLEQESRNQLLRKLGAEAIWTGQGGDHIFWAYTQLPIAADYLESRGLGPGFIQVVLDAARLNQCSYYSVLRTALALRRSRGPWEYDEIRKQQGHFVNLDALPKDLAEYSLHPWSLGLTGLPKAKQLQITLLADVLNRHRHMPRAECAYQRHPLLSRPILETCLQIPSYVLVKGGRRRALARHAFRTHVPREILERDDKGETSARIRAMVRENEAFFRRHLLDGILVREKIVQRQALSAIFEEGQSYSLYNCWTLLGCMSAEIWARTWTTGRSMQVAA